MSTRTARDPAEGVTVNAAQGVFVVPCFGGVTCLGFEVAERRRAGLAAWSGLTQAPAKPGTLDSYRAYEAAVAHAQARHKATGDRCPSELVPQLIGLEGRRVEVVDAYGERRRFQVGKSTGWWPIHLEVHNARSTGGMAVTGAPFKSVRVVR